MDLGQVIDLAMKIHRGQTDKSGRPYHQHLSQVASAVRPFGVGAEMAGWLHDSVEDHLDKVNLHLLKKHGVPLAVVDVVDCVTRRKQELYSDFVRRATTNYTAALVKLADNAHNSQPERLLLIEDEETRSRLNWKYFQARHILVPAVAAKDAATIFNELNPELTRELMRRATLKEDSLERLRPPSLIVKPRPVPGIPLPDAGMRWRPGKGRTGLWRSR